MLRQTNPFACRFKPSPHQVGMDALPPHAVTECRVIVATAMHLAHPRHDLCGIPRKLTRQPILKQVGHLTRQPQTDGTGRDCTGVVGLLQNGFQLMIGQPGDQGRHAHADRYTRRGQPFDDLQAARGRRHPGLHRAGNLGIQSGDGYRRRGQPVSGHVSQNVDVPLNQASLGHNRHGMPESPQNVQNATHDAPVSLNRLVSVSVGANRQNIRGVTRAAKLPFQGMGCIRTRNQPRLEIQARRQPQIGMAWPRKAIDAPVLAPSVRIEGPIKRYVRRRVARYRIGHLFTGDLRSQHRQIVFRTIPAIIGRDACKPFKAASIILHRAAAFYPTGQPLRSLCSCSIIFHHPKLEQCENICKGKSVQAFAMSQNVAPETAQRRITLLTQDHDAYARVEEF